MSLGPQLLCPASTTPDDGPEFPALLLDTFTAPDNTDPTTRDLDTHPAAAGFSRWRVLLDDARYAGKITSHQLVGPATGDNFPVELTCRADDNSAYISEFPYFVFAKLTHSSTAEPDGGDVASFGTASAGSSSTQLSLKAQGLATIYNQGESGGDGFPEFALGAGTHKIGVFVDSTHSVSIADGAVLGVWGDVGASPAQINAAIEITNPDGNKSIDKVAVYTGITLEQAIALTVSSPPVPPPTSNTIAQLNFDIYPFTDVVSENHVIANGHTSANFASAVSFGGSTGSFFIPAGGSGDVDTAPNNAQTMSTRAIEVEGFTLEYFVRFDGVRGTNWDVEGQVDFRDEDGNIFRNSLEVLYHNGAERIGFNFSSNVLDFPPGSADEDQYFPYSPPNGQWIHVAFVLDVNVIRIYAEGIKRGEMTAVVTQANKIAGLKFTDMALLTFGVTAADRYVDGFRVSRGALYDADFTPPTAQFAYP